MRERDGIRKERLEVTRRRHSGGNDWNCQGVVFPVFVLVVHFLFLEHTLSFLFTSLYIRIIRAFVAQVPRKSGSKVPFPGRAPERRSDRPYVKPFVACLAKFYVATGNLHRSNYGILCAVTLFVFRTRPRSARYC